MSHMVIFESQDGSTGQQHCDDLDGAVGFVEALRNEQGIDRARIFRMEEVNFEVTPYYVVSLAEANGLDAASAASGVVIPSPPGAEATEPVEVSALTAPEERPADPFAGAEEAPADPFAAAEEAPADPFPTPEGDPFAMPAEADSVDAAFGDVFEAEAQAVADAEIPPIPPVEEAPAEDSGRRGLFGR